MPDHRDGQPEPIGEVVDSDRLGVCLVMQSGREPPCDGGPIIKAEKGSDSLRGYVCRGVVKVNALQVEDGAQCRQAVRVEVVRADPDAFPEFGEMQCSCGFAQRKSVGRRPTVQRNDRQLPRAIPRRSRVLS